MKKTIKMIGMACLLGAFAFAGSSCKKEKTEVTSIKVSVPQVEVIDIEGDRAYIDYFDNNLMKWSKDDTIAIYNLAENEEYQRSIRNPYKLVSGANTPNGYFSGDDMGEIMNTGFGQEIDPEVGEVPGYYAFYPYSKVKNHPIGPRNSQTFDVPATQYYVENCMDPTSLVMAVKGTNILNGFMMDHIFGFINLRLKGTKAVERIVVTDNEFGLNGNITLDLSYMSYANARVLKNRCAEIADSGLDYYDIMSQVGLMLQNMNYTVGAGDNNMTLECGGVELNPNTPTNFIMTLRPGALHHGFTVTVYYTEGEPDVFNKFNPQSDEWFSTPFAPGADINSKPYPRGFCVQPGYILNFNLN